MMQSLLHTTVCLGFTMLLMTISLVINSRHMMNRVKNSPFECGFDPKESARLPFSLRFFLLAVIFIVFDVEITLLFPMVLSMMLSSYLNMVMAGVVFIIILMGGALHEWKEGSLSWIS